MLIVRAYWLSVSVWSCITIFLILFLIPTRIYIKEYNEATEYAQQHCDLHGDLKCTVFGKIIDNTLFNAAFWTAVATIAIGCFTGTLWWSTRGLLRATNESIRLSRESIDLARDEFNATHRPKLRVRVMKPPLTNGKTPTIKYTIVNIGERLAIIKHHQIMWYVQPTSDNTSVTPERHSLQCHELKPGQSESKNIHITDFSRSFDLAAGEEFKIRGIIRYEDDTGIIRRTGFLRTYNAVLCCFRTSEDKGEEYED